MQETREVSPTKRIPAMAYVAFAACLWLPAQSMAQSAGQDRGFIVAGDKNDRGLVVSIGARLWLAQWDSWNVDSIATGVAVGDDRYEVVESRKGTTEAAPIISVSARYGSVFVSASAMTSTDYTLRETATPGGFDVRASRRERDLNLGYLFFPGLSVTAGYKEVLQTFGVDEYKWRGPVVGVGAYAPLAEAWGLYMTLGFGRLKGSFPEMQPDASGRTRFDANYALVEVGLTYGFSAVAPWLRSLVLTAGYRAQRMATKDYALAVVPSQAGPSPATRPNTSGELVDVTQGLVLGVQASF